MPAPTTDQPGFIAKEPEHCHDCNRPIRGGERYLLTREQADVRVNCGDEAERIRTTDGLVVEREDSS